MRNCVVGIVLLALPCGLLGDPPNKRFAERVTGLVKQLGHEDFAKREQASKELDAIGEPALSALRQAAADGDAEIRRRAERLIASITERIRAAITRKELEKLHGTWALVSYETNGQRIKGEDPGHVFTFTQDKWSLRVGGQLFQAGSVAGIEVNEKHNAIDLLIAQGSNVGATALSIYAVVGDTLKYLNCGESRATEFTTRPGDGRHYLTFRRVADPVKKR